MSGWVGDWIVPSGATASPGLYALVTAVSLLMIATSKGGFGGLAVVASPLMMTVIDAKSALGILLPMLVVCDVMTLPHYPREFTWRPVKLLAPWTMIGILIGWMLLGRVSQTTVPWLNVGIGALSVVFAGLEMVRWAIVRRTVSSAGEVRPWRPGVLASVPFGLTAGLCTMLAHAAGAVTTIYLLPQRFDSQTFVGTTNRFYLVFNLVKVPFYAYLGLITLGSLRRSLWLLPVAFFGVWAGAALNRRVSQRGFRFIVVSLLLCTGAMLIWRDRWVLTMKAGG
jgi:uncharacterized membrane protein YfcA